MATNVPRLAHRRHTRLPKGHDESREQTRAILTFQRKRHTLEGKKGKATRETLIRKHRNFQRLLKPIMVVNPYAEKLVYSDDRLQSRRDQPKYLNIINAVAFLRQFGVRPTLAPLLERAGVTIGRE